MTEHSAVIFVFFFLAEYASIVLICILTSIFFLGGYYLNYISIIYFKEIDLCLNDPSLYFTILNIPYSEDGTFLSDPLIQGMTSSLTLGFKACVMIFVFIWARASLPRIRYDQLMSFCWTILLPLVIAFIILLPCILYSLEIIATNVSLLLFPHILSLQLVEGKATSRYLWLTSQFYYDLLQTILSRVFNFLEWGLNSTPKPHAFVSLPVQSSFFSILSRFINIIKDKCNETFFYTVSLVYFIYFAYRLPTKFMLSELDMLLYLPLFSIIYSLCCAFIIGQISKKELTISRLVFIVFSGLSIPLIIYLFSGNFNELHVCICSALALVSGMAITSEGPVVIDVLKKLTLYKYGDSNASTPPAGQNSGSSNRPSRPNPMSISSILADPDPATRSSHGPVSGSAAAGTSGSSSSNAESAGTQPQPTWINDECTRDNMSNADLDNKFGPIPPKEEVDGIYNKIIAQKREIGELNRRSTGSTIRSTKSIFGDYSPEATLSPKDIKGLARMLLGEHNRFIATVKGDSSNPYIRLMIMTGGTRRPIEQSNDVINILRKNNS